MPTKAKTPASLMVRPSISLPSAPCCRTPSTKTETINHSPPRKNRRFKHCRVDMHRSSHDDGEMEITMAVFTNRLRFNRRPFLAACARCGQLPEPTRSGPRATSALSGNQFSACKDRFWPVLLLCTPSDSYWGAAARSMELRRYRSSMEAACATHSPATAAVRGVIPSADSNIRVL